MTKFFTNYKLANLTWFKTGGNAEKFFIPKTEEELIFALKNNYCIDENNQKHYLFNEENKMLYAETYYENFDSLIYIAKISIKHHEKIFDKVSIPMQDDSILDKTFASIEQNNAAPKCANYDSYASIRASDAIPTHPSCNSSLLRYSCDYSSVQAHPSYVISISIHYDPDASMRTCYFNSPARAITILGACSNVLIHDAGIKGLVVKLGYGFSSIKLDETNKLIFIKAGCMNYTIANFCMQNGISGFEFLIGIPGTIGGGVVMNAGAYLKEYKDIINENFYAVKCIDFYGNIKFFNKDECNFIYRNSKFQKLKNYIIVEVVLQYNAIDLKLIPEIQKNMLNIKETRKKTQPITEKTCGSTFANPLTMQAWKVIELLGLRGFKIGGASISKLHTNFIINESCATSNDILQLICLIKKLAMQKLNINLQTEIQFLGFNSSELKHIYM